MVFDLGMVQRDVVSRIKLIKRRVGHCAEMHGVNSFNLVATTAPCGISQ